MKDGAPISIRPSERGIHNPFAKGGIARTTLAGLFALTGAQMFDAGCAVRTLAPGADSPSRPAATEPSSPSLPYGIANTSATEVAAGRPPVKIDTPMAPQVGTAVAEADQIKKDREAAARAEAAAQAAKPVNPVAGGGDASKAGEGEKAERVFMIPKEYLSQAKLIEWTDPTDKTTYLFVAFNLPAETPLFAGADGMLNKSVEGDAPFTGNRSTVIDRSFSPPVVIDIRVADMVYDNGKIPAEEKVKKGQKFGKVGNNGKKHAGPFADFNTLISLSIKGSDGKFSPPREMYNDHLPGVDVTMAKKVSYDGPVKPSYGYKFGNPPQ